MGQKANSGRQASLDEKKQRAAGRKQNDPAVQAITDRQSSPPVAGAFGKPQPADDRGENLTTGQTSGDDPAASNRGAKTSDQKP
jgi:hypothetical protein